MNAIDDSELFLVLLTKNSLKSQWVNQEIGYALGKGIPIIPLKKGNPKIKGLIETRKYVKIQNNPVDTVKEVFEKLKNADLSPRAQIVIFTFIGALKLKAKYGGIKK